MLPSYTTYAPIYDQLGLADFAQEYTPRIIRFLQEGDWMGRKILDVGCGTGISTNWLARNGYIVTAIDQSTDMISQARNLNHTFHNIEWQLANILKPLEKVNRADLAFAWGLINELNGVGELQAAFQHIYQVLETDRPLAFDVFTLQGILAGENQTTRLVVDSPTLTVFSTDRVDFERQTLTTQYYIYYRQEKVWVRANTERTCRAYPIQALDTVLKRVGFKSVQTLNLSLEPIQNLNDQLQIIMIARK